MKRILIGLIAALTIAFSAQAQVTWTRDAAVSYSDLYSGEIVSFTGTVDSVCTDTSAVFTFAGYQGDAFSLNPIQYTKKLASAAAKPCVKIIFQGQLSDGNWTNVDTLGTADSLETVQRGTIDFNNLKSVQYRMILSGTTSGTLTNATDATFSLYLFLPRKDN